MTIYVTVPHAEQQLQDIADFIATGNLQRASEYIDTALGAFFDLSGNRVPVRASERLPSDVRKLIVPGFSGYSLRVLYRGEYIALVAAFRPGLTTAMQDRTTRLGLREFKSEHE